MKTLLYHRLRSEIVNMMLDHHTDGDLLPSVRALAERWGANPLTVSKAYQPLIQKGIVRPVHGVGLFVAERGMSKLRKTESLKFLSDTWPGVREEASRLHINLDQLLAATFAGKRIDTPAV